jgi:hypothetical protein
MSWRQYAAEAFRSVWTHLGLPATLPFYVVFLAIDLGVIVGLRKTNEELEELGEEIQNLRNEQKAVERTSTEKRRRLARQIRQKWIFLVLLLVVEATGLIVQLQPSGRRWETVVALLPLLLVLYHSANLWAGAPGIGIPKTGRQDALPSKGGRSPQAVIDRVQLFYHWETIGSRYVVPALLLPLVGAVAFAIASKRPDLTPPPLLRYLEGGAFEYGLLGAYLYIFLELGRRSVRHDITQTTVIWCLITLVIGPPFAAALPYVFGGGDHPQANYGLWNQKAVWIFAGYSPRILFQTLIQGVLKALGNDSSSVQATRQLPLSLVQGIGVDEAERWAEEGIKDVHALGCAEPVRLMRDTRFDNWRIISWIDQAIVISTVPEPIWRALIRRGFQGATDLGPLVVPRRPKDKTKEDDDKRRLGRGSLPPSSSEAPREMGATSPPLAGSSTSDPDNAQGRGESRSVSAPVGVASGVTEAKKSTARQRVLEDVEKESRIKNLEFLLIRIYGDARVDYLKTLIEILLGNDPSKSRTPKKSSGGKDPMSPAIPETTPESPSS